VHADRAHFAISQHSNAPGLCRPGQACAGIRRDVRACAGMCGHVRACAGKCRHVEACANVLGFRHFPCAIPWKSVHASPFPDWLALPARPPRPACPTLPLRHRRHRHGPSPDRRRHLTAQDLHSRTANSDEWAGMAGHGWHVWEWVGVAGHGWAAASQAIEFGPRSSPQFINSLNPPESASESIGQAQCWRVLAGGTSRRSQRVNGKAFPLHAFVDCPWHCLCSCMHLSKSNCL
jgi:hypothetical protein